MALKKSYTANFGSTYTAAYFRIVEFFINSQSEFAIIRVYIYKSEADRDANKSQFEQKEYTIKDSIDEENPENNVTDFTDNFKGDLTDNHIKKSYKYLKTLDAYSDAVDV